MAFAFSLEEQRERRAAQKALNMRVNCTPSKALRRGNYEGGGTSGKAIAKTEPKRKRALLDMAKGRECLLNLPWACVGGTETTIAAHSNLATHGKAGARKADDQYSVWACHGCHGWLDAGGGTWLEKELEFRLAHCRQVVAWRLIASDPSEPARFRKAAQWALDQLSEQQGEKA